MNIVSTEWNTSAAIFLEPACCSNYTINELAFDVQKGNCQLFDVYEGEQHIASMVLRLEEGATRELVVVALGGRYKGALIQTLNKFWDGLAKSNDARFIRAHVSRKGMARLMERAGGVLSEFVYKREVV
ncbi:MAG: hypothetical protein ACRBDL_03405 [Alphaproteobacteria bacterium]